jgi:hypothetical protein
MRVRVCVCVCVCVCVRVCVCHPCKVLKCERKVLHMERIGYSFDVTTQHSVGPVCVCVHVCVCVCSLCVWGGGIVSYRAVGGVVP